MNTYRASKFIFFALIMICFPAIGFANSGPAYWYSHPSSEIMLIDETSSMTVEHENLVFDFSDSEDFSHTINGKVTATYDMVNPTDKLQSVQMVFPFVGSLNRFSKDDIAITADKNKVIYDVFIGEVVDNYGNAQEPQRNESYDFVKIVNSITNEIYTSNQFGYDQIGLLYKVEVTPTTEERINLEFKFNYSSEETQILTKGFNGYQFDGKTTTLTAWCYEPTTLEIFVLGKDINFDVNAYADGERRQKTDLYSYQVLRDEVAVKSYLLEQLKKHSNKENLSDIPDPQLYNLYAKALDDNLIRNNSYLSWYDLHEKMNERRILSLVYTVDFPPNSKKEIVVSYRAFGTMDKTETITPLYTFDYILNPAKKWKDFGRLDIEIIPSEQAPHIVKSNLSFEKDKNKTYKASLVELPNDDLSFTLYTNEKITFRDKLEGSFYSRFRFLTPVMIGFGMPILLIVGFIWLVKRNYWYN